MSNNILNSLFGFRIIRMTVILYMLFTLPSLADDYGLNTAFECGSGLFNIQTTRTVGKAHYSFGVQSLTMQREYFIVEENSFAYPKDITTMISVPLTYGLTNFIDLSSGFHFYQNARPYKNISDIYDYHSSPESGISVTHLGLKIRLPRSMEKRFQIAGECLAMLASSKNQSDGMNYQWTRTETDIETSLLETIDLNSWVSFHFKQGYVFSGSQAFDDQVVCSAGIDIHPFNKWSFGLGLHNRTFMGVSPQSLIKAIYDPFQYWDTYEQMGNPAYLKDEDMDFNNDYFIVVPSISYRLSDFITLNAGAMINIADQRGPDELMQFTVGITYNGAFRWLVDSDADGIKDNRDREQKTPRGFPVNNYGISLDFDNDGVPDGRDNQPDSPEGVRVDQVGVAVDSDSDGVYDGIDREPDTREGLEVNRYGVTLDDDGDGIPNTLDKEPDTPKGYKVDRQGVRIIDERKIILAKVEKKEITVEKLPFSVHVSSYRSITGAEADVDTYFMRGYQASKVFTMIPGMGNWYRVYVGRFKTKDEAQKVARVLINREYTNYAKVMEPGKTAVIE